MGDEAHLLFDILEVKLCRNSTNHRTRADDAVQSMRFPLLPLSLYLPLPHPTQSLYLFFFHFKW